MPVAFSQKKLKPGAVVRCRTRRYLVEDVKPPEGDGSDTVVSMACMEDQAIGQKLTVFLEREIDFEVLGESSWELVAKRGFDRPKQFSAYLNTLRWNCVTATDSELFQSPYRAGIDIKAYQLEPLRKALLMPRVGLFIADDVGLGKTIEAGLILREMLLRQRIRRVVISCPPSVLRQWQEEMSNRFGLSFTVMDRAFVAKVRQERGYGTNPWSTGSRFLISHSLLRNSSYSAPLIDWLDQSNGNKNQYPLQSLLIFDEAHNAAPSSNSVRYAIDSGLTRSLRDLSLHFEHRIFMSATPHNGHSNSFTALLELLDPSRFTRGVPFDQNDLDTVLVRRLKDDLRRIGEEFPERIVEPLIIPKGSLEPSTPELSLSRLLQQYRKQREHRLVSDGATKRQINSDRLVITNLQKRLLSSVEAFSRTLAVHQSSIADKQKKYQASQLDSQLELIKGGVDSDSELADLNDEDLLILEDSQTRSVLSQTYAPNQSDLEILDKMTKIAERHRTLPDARIILLKTWLREHLCPGLGTDDLKWKQSRLLIFTDYVASKQYLETQLRLLLGEREAMLRVASFTGGMSEYNREELKKKFNADPDQEKLRILIATDAAREGVNLQNHCKHLIHFDIPWNPSKLEQRNGRIDRKLQRSKKVWCHYFLLEDRPEDRVMEVLVRKTEVIRNELGSLSPLVQRQVDDALDSGIDLDQLNYLRDKLEFMDSTGSDLGMKINRAKEELEANRRVEVLEQQQVALRKLLAKSREWLAFAHDRFRQALNCSFDLLGVTGLEPHTDARGQKCWRLSNPEDLPIQTRDKSWENTLDSLRGIKPAKAYLNDWRKENPVRPVIFSDPGRLSAESVHLHLEHRLAQRLLSRFLSQGFLCHELSRACVLPCSNSLPIVVVLGRLSMFGQGAARLHDELIVVGATWHSEVDRKSSLQALTTSNNNQIWSLLQNALSQAEKVTVQKSVTDRYQGYAEQDVITLLPLLKEKSDDIFKTATDLLKKRGASEAASLREVLRSQRNRINATLKKRTRDLAKLEKRVAEEDLSGLIPGLEEQIDVPDLDLNKLSKQERKQLAVDQRHWNKRLKMIENELNSEPQRIVESYKVVTHRLEPAGLVYLTPAGG